MKKYLPIIGIVITIIVIVLLHNALSSKVGDLEDKVEALSTIEFGGVTNLDSLTLGEDLIVGGTTTQTGAFTVAANLNADGGFIEGGYKDYGYVTFVSVSAADVCDNEMLAFAPDGNISISLPHDGALKADCMSSTGDTKRFSMDNNSSLSSAFGEIITRNLVFYAASTGCDMTLNDDKEFSGNEIYVFEVRNMGTSLSWYCDAFTASVSYQPQ